MGSDVTPGQLNLPAKDRFAWHVGLALFCLPLQIRWGQWAVMSPLGSDVTPGQRFDMACGRFDTAREGRFDVACVAFPFEIRWGQSGQ